MKNITWCSNSRSANSREIRWGCWHKQFSMHPYPTICTVERYIGLYWTVLCFHPYFVSLLFADLHALPTLYNIVYLFILSKWVQMLIYTAHQFQCLDIHYMVDQWKLAWKVHCWRDGKFHECIKEVFTEFVVSQIIVCFTYQRCEREKVAQY